MEKVITSEKLPIKLWLNDIEPGAMAQARNLANLSFAFKHIAIMPDAHEGYGMPIGGVLATQDVIIPNAVGVDIGCGMCTVRTSLKEIDTARIKAIMSNIREVVPLGFAHHKRQQNQDLMPQGYEIKDMKIVGQEYNSALHQVGTLGGGNHFIELQKGSDGHIWIMVHSGSRNIGLKVAEYYNKLAETLDEKWDEKFNRKSQLAWLPLANEKGKQYINEMNYCVEFALANRRLMMQRIMDIFQEITYCDFIPFQNNLITNIAHNFAKMEKHFRTNVMVHRKGATLATKETIGIIPGSQGTKSYIVKGKGNKQSFESCSHGAGRKMGRNEARKKLNLEEEVQKLNDKGIIHAIRHQKDLDEAAGAYKDIDTVMKNQSDLVDILIELKPLAVIKG